MISLVLASTSLYRKALLEKLGIPFVSAARVRMKPRTWQKMRSLWSCAWHAKKPVH